MRVVSDEWIAERNRKLLEWFGGNVEAVEFLLLLSEITELWDDLIDRDKPVYDHQINAVFTKALVVLPQHPFYRKHTAYLSPLIMQAINAWMTANTFQKGTKSERALAYTLRNVDIMIAEAIVYLTCGWQRMREVSPELWRYFGAEQDDIDEWLADKSQELEDLP